MTCKVLVTEALAAEGLALLGRCAEVTVRPNPTREELLGLVGEYDALVVRDKIVVAALAIAAMSANAAAAQMVPRNAATIAVDRDAPAAYMIGERAERFTPAGRKLLSLNPNISVPLTRRTIARSSINVSRRSARTSPARAVPRTNASSMPPKTIRHKASVQRSASPRNTAARPIGTIRPRLAMAHGSDGGP